MDLEYYAELAHNTLNSETQYLSNKAIISTLFKDQITNDFENVVRNRITIIDSYYSTQMSKRLYGIDELAKAITVYSDNELKNETSIFLNNPDKLSVINSLFSKEYGIDKSGKPFGKSISLISKYIYFLNDGNFPIYDSLAIDSYKLLKKNNLIISKTTIKEKNYFAYMKQLNSDTNINSYEKLDNLLWLIGKLSKGSFGILMDKEKYLRLIENNEIKADLKKPENKKSSAKDEIIRSYIKQHYKASNFFSDNQKIFFAFVFSLK